MAGVVVGPFLHLQHFWILPYPDVATHEKKTKEIKIRVFLRANRARFKESQLSPVLFFFSQIFR